MRHLAPAALAGAVLALAVAAPVSAQADKVLYSDNFDTDNNGKPQQNYSVPGFFSGYDDSSVDLVFTGDGSGVRCAGGVGGCLDLGGSTMSPALLLSNDVWNFKAGDVFTLQYSFSGNQQPGAAPDRLFIGFDLDDEHSFDYDFITSNGRNETGTLTAPGFGQDKSGTPFDFPFTDVTLRFRPRDSGFFGLRIDGYSYASGDNNVDNHGIILDNLKLSAAVPEPAGWAMMLAGFGTLGAMLRRHRRNAPALRPV